MRTFLEGCFVKLFIMNLKALFSCILFFVITISVAQTDLTLKVGSYNIRYDNHGDREAHNAWEDRLPVIASMINWEEADIFGAQEVLVRQLKDMEKALPDYAYYGVGRDDGKEEGEFAPVFYKKDRFTLLQSGNFWLSETPDQPSKGWDAALPRICTYVELEEQKTGMRFWFFNLHMDHVGIKAREESSKLVIQKIKEIAKDKPAFLTGDFNVDQNNAIYTILSESGILKDAFDNAKHKMAWNGTFNAFDTELWTDSRIDHIFTTNGIKIDKYAVLTETYRRILSEDEIKKGDFPEELSSQPTEVRLPSDHFPIFARVRIPLQ